MTHITRNIYISGVPELEKMDLSWIGFIVCCLDPGLVIHKYRKIAEKYPNIVVLFLPMDDHESQNLFSTEPIIRMANSKFIPDSERKYQGRPFAFAASDFINHAASVGSGVLVHCMAGISRSVSMVAYHMMVTYGISYDEAIRIIRSRRHIANPNPGFVYQLKHSEKWPGFTNGP